jgi:hypothetical protein
MKTNFFEEAPGVKSSMRLMSFILLWFLGIWDTLLILDPFFKMDTMFITFNFVMLVGVFIPKYLQKLAEVK